MSKLTVGNLEDMLRAYPKDTIIHTGCRCCSHGAIGDNILSIEDMTNQTFGYIKLKLNATIQPKKEATADEIVYYGKKIEELMAENMKLKVKNEKYKEALREISRSINSNINWIDNM